MTSTQPLNLLDLVVPAYHPFFESKAYYCVLRGGRSAGKSVAIAQKIIWRCISEKNHRFVVIRDKMTDHSNSTYTELKTAIEMMGITKHAEFYKSPIRINMPDFNSEIIFVGLDDPQRLKGLSGMTGIWFEEPSEINEQSIFEETMSGFRARIRPDSYAQVYLSFNPINIDHWLKNRFYDNNPDKDRTFLLKTTYLDNPHLSGDTIRTLLSLKYTDPVKYTVNVLGEWGRTQMGGEFYKCFKYGIHVDSPDESGQLTEAVYNRDLPLHISFDFNVMPHLTMIISQRVNDTLRVIDEMTAATPYNSTYGICQKFINHPTYSKHNSGLFIYGDPSGNNRSINSLDNKTSYTLIIDELKHYNPILRVNKSFPRVNIRGQWINQIFDLNLDNIRIIINPKCEGLIRDFLEMKEDSNGIKSKEKGYKSGMKYEKYGHFSDAFDYMMCELFKSEWNRFSGGNQGGVSGIITVPRLPPKHLY